MANLPADPIGYGFAYFRSHSMSLYFQDWYAPGYGYEHGYKGWCKCGKYEVSAVHHYHDMRGRCHTLEICA